MNLSALYNELTGKIARTRRLEHSVAVQAALLNALTVCAAVCLLALTAEALFRFGPGIRTGLYWGVVCVAAAGSAFLLARPLARLLGLLRGQDDDAIAQRVGRKIPEVGDRLVNTLQLFRSVRPQAAVMGYSADLAEASIAVQGEPLKAYDYSVIVERDRRWRALILFLLTVVAGTVLLTVFGPAYSQAWHRLRHYDQEFLPPVPPAPFTLQISPGDRTVLRGDSVAIVVRATGIPPRVVHLVLGAQGAASADTLELREDSAGVYRHTVYGIRVNTICYASSGPVRTPSCTLRVTERPEIQSLRVVVTPPAYTGHGTQSLPENTGDVSGVRGTSVSVRVTSTIPVVRGTIVQIFPRVSAVNKDSNRLPIQPAFYAPGRVFDTVRTVAQVNGTSVWGGFRLTRDGQYYISLTTADGLSNTSPVVYNMAVSTDGSPVIALVQPGDAQVAIDPSMILPTRVRIGDDYGFSRLRLMWRISASKFAPPQKDFTAQALGIPHGDISNLDVPYVWDMTKTSIVPEDEVEFYFEVFDNDVVTGPKSARTQTVTIKFPSLEEALKGAEKAQTQATADLDKVLKGAQEARKQMDELNRELMKQLAQRKEQAGWQEQQKLQEVMKQHEQMEKKLQEIAENMQNVQERLQEAKALQPETMQKYMELQKLFQEIKNPELMKSMLEMQKAMEKMTPEQMADAMKNFKFNEEQFRQAIDRTMKILQRMQAEQKTDELIRRADDLQNRQNALDQQMKNFDPKDKSAQQQFAERLKDMSKSAAEMKRKADELSKQMNEIGEDMPKKEMAEAQQSLEQDDPEAQMEQASEQMQAGQPQQAGQKTQASKESLEKFRQKMQAVRKKLQENTRQAAINTMRKSLRDLLELSKRQEELKNQAAQSTPNSQLFRDMAQQQGQMQQDMQNITNQMMSLGNKSFSVTPEMGREMGDALRQMNGAAQSLEGRDGVGASQKQGQAMGAMNRAAMQMQGALGQMQGQGQQGQGQGGMGMSFQQRLGQMAGQQQTINMAMGQKGQGGQGEGEGQGKGKNGKQGEGGQEGQGEGEQSDPNGKPGTKKLQRLTRQQQEVKKSLEQLNQEARQSGGTRKNMAGDLDRAVKEMEEVVSDMQSGNVTPQTVERQERILSRLLDAMKSQRERDYEKERESKPGQDVVRRGPGDLQFSAPSSAPALRDPLRGRDSGYTQDYEQMIRQYFQAMRGGAGN